ncbi:MAG TPA: DEAD/DEAH box helicase [Gemmatimonadaceae bacterium]|nr:DEAD/DEAH box helicase [Gemmatimonadaceae bacterium]
MVSLSGLRLRAVRARVADVTSECAAPAALGSITLTPHQQRAVSRVLQMIAQVGGCLLADDVGRGKTYVALAVAGRWARPLVVVPASLRTTWQRAMRRADVDCAMVTHESLSGGALPSCDPDVVIVDESHRFRSPASRRHAALTAITARVPVLLLSATPLQNRTRDLAAQVALFLGSSAFRWDEERLARFVVRGADGARGAGLPRVAPPAWLRTGHDDGAVLRAILALPPPTRAIDAGDAGALRTIGLVRAWASSRAALVAALHRRLRSVAALEQCAAEGLAPTRHDLRAWYGQDGEVQLAFAPLLVAPALEGGRALSDAVNVERIALDRLHAMLRESPDPDVARADALRRLRTEHPAVRILAFSEFASTVRAFFRLLGSGPGVGMLTATEARIASGRLSRDELLDRFAPAGRGAREPAPREQVTLLLTTDLLSEGVNLQDARIVVQLDLPWNPARLAQRLGRVRRPGGASIVESWLMSPPATTELLLRVEARLRTKLARAERTIGRTLDVLPALAPSGGTLADASDSQGRDDATFRVSAALRGTIADRVASWRRASPCSHAGCARDAGPAHRPFAAAADCGDAGWLAALSDGRLLARLGSSPPDTSGSVARAVELACSPPRPCHGDECPVALADAEAWLARERLTLACGMRDDAPALDAAIERRIARVLAHAPRHARARLHTVAARLRDRLGRSRTLGAERELERLVAMHTDRRLGDDEWLTLSLQVTERAPARLGGSEAPRVVAVIVLGPAPRARERQRSG